MAQYSFPVLEQPMSDQQWGQVTEGFGSGILARRSEPYGFPAGSIDNAANTIYVGGRSPVTNDGRAIVSGFFHRYDANEVFTFPAVTSTRTYHFGLTYDPTKHGAPGGPVSLGVNTSRPSGGGKVYLPIYSVTRRANELLSDATLVDHRAFIAPQITVKGIGSLPPADSVLTYTVATDWVTGQQWQMQLNGAWKATGARAVAVPSTSGWDRGNAVVVVQPLADGRNEYRVEVEMQRTGTTYTQGTSFTNNGTLLAQELRGTRGLVYAPAKLVTTPGEVAINTTTGAISSRVYAGTTAIGAGQRITFSAMWVA